MRNTQERFTSIEEDSWEDILIEEDNMQAWESRFLDEAERATDELFDMREEL